MARGGGMLRMILDALFSAVSKEVKRGGTPQNSASKSQPGSSRTHKPTARLRTVSVSDGAADIESPGRNGRSATRELTREEVRTLHPSYDPAPDGDPDPGEIVWTWVPYVENDGRGKDRPVLIIARIDEVTTAGCYLSTKEHRGFVSIGTGTWDAQGRESFLAPERVLCISDAGMRREGHVLGRDRFDSAVAEISRLHGIS